jgi:hypothetical protein
MRNLVMTQQPLEAAAIFLTAVAGPNGQGLWHAREVRRPTPGSLDGYHLVGPKNSELRESRDGDESLRRAAQALGMV